MRSFSPSPHLLVLFSEVVLSLFGTYIYHILTDMFITLFIHNILLLSTSIFFFFQSLKKKRQVIYFITAEWLIGKYSRTLDLMYWSLRLKYSALAACWCASEQMFRV